MTINQLINLAQTRLIKNQLDSSVSFKILFHLSKKINNLNDFNDFKNQKVNLFFQWKYYYLLLQYINLKKPLAYIFKTSEFYHQTFIVDKKVHIPKIESEIIIEIAVFLINKNKYKKVLDLCCGTGVLGISLLNLFPIDLTLIDIDQRAINNTKKNLSKFNLKAEVIKNDLLNNINEQYDLIIINPPYVSYDDLNIDWSVKKYEPKKAIFAHNNGLYFYQKILKDISKFISKNGALILEIGFNQKQAVLAIIYQFYPNIKTQVIRDQFNHDRIIVVYFNGE